MVYYLLVVVREPGLYHLAAVPLLVVLEQDDDEQHLMDVVPLFVVLEHVFDKLLVFVLLVQGAVFLLDVHEQDDAPQLVHIFMLPFVMSCKIELSRR